MSEPLEDVQQWLQAALMHPGGAQQRQRSEELMQPNRRLSAPQRLAIYQRAYYARLLECMCGQFKALVHALGRDLFRDFVRLYLETHPSRSHTLAVLGSGFPAYLDATRPDRDAAQRESWIDFMVDLANFEWSLSQLFDRPGHEGRSYATLDTSDASLRPQPCLEIHSYRYPVGGYYRLVAAGNPHYPPALPTHLALLRRDYRVSVHTLQPAQYDFLQKWFTGRATLETEPNWPHWRAPWIEAGFFIPAELVRHMNESGELVR